MNSLAFPDINVWLALIVEGHSHRPAALDWWISDQSGQVGFSRHTQIGLLRLLTTSAAMDNQPLTMTEAWAAYDRVCLSDRVVFWPEPKGLEPSFRAMASSQMSSPKLWNDAYLAAFAEAKHAELVTFDRALAGRCRNSRLLTAWPSKAVG